MFVCNLHVHILLFFLECKIPIPAGVWLKWLYRLIMSLRHKPVTWTRHFANALGKMRQFAKCVTLTNDSLSQMPYWIKNPSDWLSKKFFQELKWRLWSSDAFDQATHFFKCCIWSKRHICLIDAFGKVTLLAKWRIFGTDKQRSDWRNEALLMPQ